MTVQIEQLSSHWTDLKEIWYFSFFENLSRKVVSLISSRTMGISHENQYIFLIISCLLLLRMRKSKHMFCVQLIFFSKLQYLLDKMEKYCRTGQATDDNMAHVHCILDTFKHIHLDYKILISFPLEQWLHKCAPLLSCMYIVCLVKLHIV
jgi:hypothetical protein